MKIDPEEEELEEAVPEEEVAEEPKELKELTKIKPKKFNKNDFHKFIKFKLKSYF
jgi:hypothetical protein